MTSLHLTDWITAGRPTDVCVVVAGEDALAEHYSDLLSASKITVEFAGFMDGRGFTHGRKLRELGFSGELIAGGDAIPDQWVYLKRCGFDRLASDDVNARAGQLPGFTEAYQSDARQPQPLFRRR
jgi:uncharacterized protein (DUF934 family)